MMLNKILTSIALMGVAISAHAAPYTILVPFAPGGAADSFARILAKELQTELGDTVIVDSRPGAAGSVGAAYFAKLPKDSRTLFLGTISTHAINPYLYKELNYDAKTDFQPLAQVLSVQNLLAVNAKSDIKSLSDLVAEGKNRPLTFGSPGTGSSAHLSAETMVLDSPGMQGTHVPFKGGNPSVTALLGGHVDFIFENISNVLPHIQSGALRDLAVTSTQRAKELPNTPTMDEAGFKGYEVVSWFGLWLPKGADQAEQDKFSAALNKIYQKPEFVQKVEQTGAMPTLKTGTEFEQFVDSEQTRWKSVLEKLNIQM